MIAIFHSVICIIIVPSESSLNIHIVVYIKPSMYLNKQTWGLWNVMLAIFIPPWLKTLVLCLIHLNQYIHCVYIFVYISVSISISISIYIYIYLYLYLIYLYLCLYLSIIYLSVCLSVYVYVYVYILYRMINIHTTLLTIK